MLRLIILFTTLLMLGGQVAAADYRIEWPELVVAGIETEVRITVESDAAPDSVPVQWNGSLKR